MNISDIQKYQEEYEKFLKESPFQSTIEKIRKDITDQKNNAMAMEFTRAICDLLKENGVYIHCTETKFSEKITENSIEENYGIKFDSMDFSEHDKEFTDEIEKLQSEAEKYRKAFENAKKERDCQICEYQNEIDELKQKLERQETAAKYTEEYVNNLKCSVDKKQDAINQIDSIICELFGIAHSGDIYSDDFKELLKEKSAVGKTIADFLPTEPIKVADTLISVEGECEPFPALFGNKEVRDTYRIFGIGELRQIAEHLLIYCNANKGQEHNE